jgi:hypothetical protein
VFWLLVAGREHSMFFSRQIAPRCALGGGVETLYTFL